jgi:hypothetical protein
VSKSEQKRTTEETVEITGDSLVAALREASPEIQEQAAVLVEQLEGLLATAADETGDDDE